MKRTLILGALALALGGCAAGPYYDNGYGYGPGYGAGYYDYGPSYYYGPSVGFGYYEYDRSGGRHWHDGNRHDWGRWQGDRGDQGQQPLPDRPDRGFGPDRGNRSNLGIWERSGDVTRSGGPNSDHSAVQQ